MAVQHGETGSATATGTTERTWYEEFYDAIESKDAPAMERMMTPDTSLRLGNHPEVRGLEAVSAAAQHFWTLITKMHHRFETVTEDGDLTMFESGVEYTRLDGSTVTIPAATAIVRRDGLVAAQRVYVDVSPLFGSTS
jgi:ketosteroid isomerase-like protein